MEQFDQWTRRLFLAGLALWVGLAVFDLISAGGLYLILGALVLFLGLKNMGLLVLGTRHQMLPEKVDTFLSRYGNHKGLAIYVTLFIGLYVVIGLLLILSGFKVGL